MNVENVNIEVPHKKGKEENFPEMEKIIEGKYTAFAARVIYEKQTAIKNEILNRIDDMEYSIKLCADLYKLYFEDFNKEIVTGHIMQRVLIGTFINENRENSREFIFGNVDTNVMNVFQKIRQILDAEDSLEKSKNEIRDMIGKRLKKK